MDLKKFFEDLQDKSKFSTTKYEDLSEKDNAELFSLYLKQLHTDNATLKTKLDELEKTKEGEKTANAENAKAIEELRSEMNAKNVAITDLNLKLSQTLHASTKVKDTLDNDVKALQEEVTSIFKSGERKTLTIKSKTIETATKANLLTTSVSNSTLADRSDRIGQVAHRRLTAFDIIQNRVTIETDRGGTHRYFDVDESTLIRAAAQVAEGALAPESTISFIERSRDLKETADFLPYSKRFEYDYGFFMDEVRRILNQNMLLQLENQMINGDGTGQNQTGWIASMPAWVPVASGITDANLFDVVAKMKEAITTANGSIFQPDFIALNPVDVININAMLKKDANNNYVPIMEMIARMGIQVVENAVVTANTAFFGDSRFITVLDGEDMEMEIGYIGDQFQRGLKSIRIATRKNTLIRNVEQVGFLRVTSLSGAYTTLAT